MNIVNNNLVVWDSEEQWASDGDDLCLWSSYESSEIDGVYSVLQMVENNPDQLRSQYLELIYELGETKVDGKRVIDCLDLRPEFSCWWMTLLTEKCNFAKSQEIDNAIKLMAFREWFAANKYTKISLVASNGLLAEAMQLLSIEFGVDFEWHKVSQRSTLGGIARRIYNQLPSAIQALIWLGRQLKSRWILKGVGVDQWRNTKGKITFISYLFNLVPDSVKRGHYKSHYWGTLPELLEEHQTESSWLHIYVENDFIPNSSAAKGVINRFNKSDISSQVHVTLHSFLSIRLVFSVLLDWYRLLRCVGVLRTSLQKNGGVYWPFLAKDYTNSMIGTIAMSNLLYLNLFERAMSELPHQERGVYLQENQGWEFGFIHAWQSSGHGSELVGFPHSTVRYWDLRYFYSKKCYERIGKFDLPLPDYIGVNGDAAKKMYLNGGYLKDRLVEVEALRYLYLADVRSKRIESTSSVEKNKKVLVLGDYLKNNTMQQMKLLSEAARYLNDSIQYVVKPHPACPIMKEEFHDLDMVITNDAISTLISQFSLVYCSNTTSAAVDAYCAGKAVITVLNPKGLNISPLKGRDGVFFVSTPEELAAVINVFGWEAQAGKWAGGYFYLDDQLPKWKKLLITDSKTKKELSIGDIQ